MIVVMVVVVCDKNEGGGGVSDDNDLNVEEVGRVEEQKMHAGDTHEASSDSMAKTDVVEAPDAIPLRLFPHGKGVPITALRALVKEGRKTLYAVTNCKNHGWRIKKGGSSVFR